MRTALPKWTLENLTANAGISEPWNFSRLLKKSLSKDLTGERQEGSNLFVLQEILAEVFVLQGAANEHRAERARRDSRAGRHAGDGRSLLRDATMRHGRRRDQGRAARRRLDAPDGGRVGHRQPRLQRRQSRQARHRAGLEVAGGTGRVPAPSAPHRHPHRELPSRRDAEVRAGLCRAGGGSSGADLRVDLRIRPDRPRRGQRGIRSDRPGRVGPDVGDRRAGQAAGEGRRAVDRSRRRAVRARRPSSRRCTTASGPGAASTSTRRSSKPASRCRSGNPPSTSPRA